VERLLCFTGLASAVFFSYLRLNNCSIIMTDRRHSHRREIASARATLADDGLVTDMAETFKVLSDPTRLKIVIALAQHELCTYDIAQVIGSSESVVSHQLRLLKALRLVRQRKEGKLVFTMLDDEHIDDLLRVARRHCEESEA